MLKSMYMSYHIDSHVRENVENIELWPVVADKLYW